MTSVLVVYFSRKGANYVSGKIVDLREEKILVVAHKIQNLISADLFLIFKRQ